MLVDDGGIWSKLWLNVGKAGSSSLSWAIGPAERGLSSIDVDGLEMDDARPPSATRSAAAMAASRRWTVIRSDDKKRPHRRDRASCAASISPAATTG